MKQIPLTQGKYALVDDINYEYLMQWRWHYVNCGYAARNRRKNELTKPRYIYMHRVIAEHLMGLDIRGLEVDHKNIDDPDNKLNNQQENIRVATRSQNADNRGKQSNNTSGVPGVYLTNGRFHAQVKHHGITINCGYFDTVEEASAARDAKAKELHGDYVVLNGSDSEFVNPIGMNCTNTSGYRGVSWSNHSQKWWSYIYAKGKTQHLGLWDTPEEAALAFNKASIKYRGPNAYQNKL